MTTELVVHEPPADTPALFGTSDPAEHIARAAEHARALKDVVDQRGLIADIQGKKYVLYDGWALLASMVGASIVEDWTRPLPDNNGWEARMTVVRRGEVIGAAEAMCTRDERAWAKRDDYALRSMAQTRAGAKAARTCLGFIVQLAGYQATPYDEMPHDDPDTGLRESIRLGTEKQQAYATRLLRDLYQLGPPDHVDAFISALTEAYPHARADNSQGRRRLLLRRLTVGEIGEVIDRCKDALEEDVPSRQVNSDG